MSAPTVENAETSPLRDAIRRMDAAAVEMDMLAESQCLDEVDVLVTTASVDDIMFAFGLANALWYNERGWTLAEERVRGVDRAASAAARRFDEMREMFWQ